MPTQTIQTTTDVPEFFKPYYTEALLPAAMQYYSRPYQEVYGAGLQAAGLEGAGRVAGLSPYQTRVGTELAAMGTPGQFGSATGYGQAAGNVYGTLSGVQAPTVTSGSVTGQGILGAYMSPYMQNVVDLQKQAAIRDAQQTQLAQNLGAARQGTYGGARQLLATTEREKALGSQLGSIQAQGLQSAYERALNQFNVENQLGLTAQQANQQAALQAAQQRLAAGQGLAGLASTMGQLGVAQQASDIDRLKTMGAYGDLERAVQQQGLDVRYQDLMTRLGYPQQQISGLSSVLRGVPMTDTTQQTTTPPPSFASQLAGLGLSGLGLYNLFGKS